MIDGAYVVHMARYGRWQNENLYGAAERLSGRERCRERGALFGSTHKTLNQLLWGDRMWMSRFTGSARPPVGVADSGSLCPDRHLLTAERACVDQTLTRAGEWASNTDLPFMPE